MQKNISRRGFLLSSTVAAIGTMTSRAATLKLVSGFGDDGDPEPGGVSTITDGAKRSLVAIPSSDPRFDEMVNEHFPALTGDQTFESLKGLCVVLHNKQGPGIHAHKLRWTFACDSGSFSTGVTSFLRPGPARARPLDFCSRSASRPVLRKGGVALMSPFFKLTSGKSPRQQPVDWDKAIHRKALKKLLPRGVFKLQTKQTSVTIESAVYDDYTVLDHDNGKFARRLTKKRNTEVQLAKAVSKKINEGISDSNLLSALKRTGNTPPDLSDKRKQVIFQQARRHHAKYLHDVLLNRGRDKLFELVSKQAQQPFTRFQRLTAAS